MKKLVLVIESLYHGGAEKSLITLLNLLDYSKLQVDLILFKKGGEFEKFIPKEVNIIYVNSFDEINGFWQIILRIKFWIIKRLRKNKHYHHAQLFWKVFNKSIKKNKIICDVAIAYNQGFSTYYVAKKIDTPIKYAWLNTDYQKAGYVAAFDYDMYSNYTKIICVSKENESSFIEAYKLIQKKLPTYIIKDITDPFLVKELSLEEIDFSINNNELKILTVGRLAKAKAINLAIEACYILKNNGVNLKWFVIGEGTERIELEKKIKEYELENNFYLLGYKENPYPYIKACDIYTQTSLFEGLGLTVIEATILQKPIVTTNFPTASSIITHKETGLICEMNAQSIAENILIYINDEKFKNRVIHNLSKLKNSDKEKSLESFYKLIK
ncbi:glycosyltransferase [Flaviramulus sp. BrNp1-15]|uniref:glycosyltransferase n=1 Tax=Flaviramulus sp. BrNp1-15 TaxID=2916754 RepID=UPI001EE79838|nr:glycosyltransferase [Flaviramulus sp. BrNp1-15]ULC58271.1 glycosyltransferase [Flaviramulus sp. BrNp1-15]